MLKKLKHLVLIVLCISCNLAYGQTQKVTIKNLPGNVVINKGTIKFPHRDTLKKYNVTLTYDSTLHSYTLQGVNTGVTTVPGGSIIVGNGTVINSGIISTGNGANNSIIIINGKVVSTGSPTPTFTITMPDSLDLKISSCYGVTVNNKIKNLDLNITGGSDVKVRLVKNLTNLDVTGSADVIIDSCEQVNKIDITGSSDVIIRKCGSIDNLEITGSGDVIVPQKTLVSEIDITGSGSLKRI